MSLFTSNIGIDLGTANTLIYLEGKGIIINEASVVAIDDKNQVKAVGAEAKQMFGKTPKSIKVVWPLKDGVIADFDVAKVMIRYFVTKALNYKKFARPKITICVPVGVTSIEKKAVDEVARNAGAKVVKIIEEPMAAAIGANLNVESACGNMIVDIGGGTTEIAVISLDGIVVSDSLRIAGNALDASIRDYAKRKYKLDIGLSTAERAKISIGNACAEYFESNADAKTEIDIVGRDMVTGLPRNLVLTSDEIRGAMSEIINNISFGIKRCLERTPAELSADIYANGIYLAGGGALIKGLDIFLARETGLNINIAEEPLNCVALGSGKICEKL